MSRDLTISGEIDLSGTGITGFMRDGYSSNTSEIGTFNGSLSKDSSDDESPAADAVIKLAVGERYGVYSGGSNGRGAIHRHKFNGLFARAGEGARINDISIDGFMNIRSHTSDMYAGGAIAYLTNGAELNNVAVRETINFFDSHISNSADLQCVGGLIGRSNCDEGKDVFIGGNDAENKAVIEPDIIVTGNLGNNDNNGDKTKVKILL